MKRTAPKTTSPGTKLVCQNKKARHDYFIVEEMEAGLVLKGTEVKSLRLGRANLKDSYAKIQKGEVWVHNAHIAEYPFSHYGNHDPTRPRKLLLHASEIKRLIGKTQKSGLTLIPLSIYFSHGKAKMKVALARGKKKYDKRESIKRRDQKRDMEREMK
ncbi:MAG: SsrA-binding protein SmpB [Deltaproteobacteria bacterium]|nr:SsrA-binding protein SmpB [Deltaproteobacteria bacterium]